MHEFHYRWEFDLKSSPEQLWPLVADTNRFNRDTGVPSVEMVNLQAGRNARRLLRLSAFGIPVEWEEQPFEWVRPHRFGVVRRYSKGPISELRVRVELTPGSAGGNSSGCKLVYEVWAKPKNLIGLIAIPIQIGLISARSFSHTLSQYDELAKQGHTMSSGNKNAQFVHGGRERLLNLSQRAVAQGSNDETVALLVDYLENADELALARIRPYELARKWDQTRRAVLETFLCATRAGILDLQWSLMCPLCRGGGSTESLKEVASQVHCPGCNIDFKVNFEQSVELTFRPNPSIREAEREIFCIGGPQVMPHVMAQQLLPAGQSRSVNVTLEPGRYRLRTLSLPGWQHLIAGETDEANNRLRAMPDGWSSAEIAITRDAELIFDNATDDEQLFILERTAWNGDAVMAVFRQPAWALKAMLDAQRDLARPPDSMQPLHLKAGLHMGPCIAVTLNDRLDYFGSTVNMAARLEGQSTGDDVIISSAIYNDPAVRDFLNDPANGLSASRFEMPLKGFDEERFSLWRVTRPHPFERNRNVEMLGETDLFADG